MANTKKRVLSLLMAVVMMLSAMPMNAFAIDWSGVVGDLVGSTVGELICEKQEMDHTDECYVHTDACYHSHSEPTYVMGALIYGCEYDCTEHTHSIENGCPVANCDAHAHSAECCNVEEHKHGVLCYSLNQKCSHGWQVWKCNDSCYETVLTCEKDEHDHTSGCNYVCGISTEHTHDADCYSCEIVEHTHSDACKRLCGQDGKIDSIKCALQDHKISCTNELHHKHTLEQGCYMSTEAVQNAVYKATGVVIEDPAELGAVLSTIVKCMTNSGACHVDYKVVAVSPYLDLTLVLCEEHFCSICHRLNDGYCTCVELTFTNIYNVADNSVTVKVAAGTAAGAVAPHADMTDYQFMGWFDANGNEFNAETVYTEDTTFTASYRELGEAEKLMNTIEFIKNNFDLGTEIGRIITMLTNGEVNKEKFLSEKETALNTINTALLTARLAGQLTEEQAEEIYALMNQGDEYVVMIAEWLWPTDAVEMPNIEDILNGIDYEKLAAELLVMINDYYGVDAWIAASKEQAKEYIINCLAEVKSITEAQKAALIEYIAQERAEAIQFVTDLYNDVYNRVMSEINGAKEAAKAILADREMGIRIGKIISTITGLNAEKAADKGVMVQSAIVAAIRMSSIDSKVKDALIDLIKNTDGGMAMVIAWMWPTYTVTFVSEGTVIESDVAEHGTMPSFDSAEPTKAADVQYTYTFAGWDAAFAPVTGDVTYNAVFTSSVNEYVVTFVNEDGTVLQTGNVAYGTTPVYTAAEPTKAGNDELSYTFAGWNKMILPVSGDATYTATYTSSINEYVVTFVNYEGTVLQSTNVAYGTTPVYTGATPEKAADAQYSYTFAGWDNEIAAVTGTATYTATYTPSINEYVVTFVNYDGTVLQTGKVAYGTTPVYTGAEPTRAADAQYTYNFTGWDNAIAAVTGNATYTATYDPAVNQYTVTVISDGKVINTKTVDYGTSVDASIAPATSMWKEGYDCIGWKDSDGNEVTFPFTVEGNVIIEAVWQIQTFTVIWEDVDGTVLETDYNVPYGTVASYDGAEPTKPADERYIWSFDGFQNDNQPVTANVTYRATYVASDRLYNVNFVYGNTVIKTENVKYEAAATAPEAADMPVVKNHKFTGWDVAFDCVTGDLTVNAKYTRTHNDSWDMKVNIGFGGVSGSDSTSGFINLGKKGGKIYDAKVFESFKNWPKSTIMEGTDYSSYMVKDGVMDKVTWNGTVYYNETGVENPTHDDFFQIYNTVMVATKGEYHMDNHATAYHTVKFVVDGVEHKVVVVHGEEIVVPEEIAAPTKSGYEFIGWDTEFTTAEKSMTITAQFVKLHTVTFNIPAYAQNEFGMKSTVKVQVRDGETVEALALANGTNYEFVRWYQKGGDYTKSFKFSTPITGNLTLVPYVQAIKADRDLYIYGEVDGQKFELGVGTITNVAWAGEFNGIYNNVLQSKHYKWNENVIMPEQYADITVDGITYTYGEGSSKNFYTVEMTKKVHIIKKSGEFVYSANGTISLFHTVTYNLPGSGGSYVVTAAHGSKLEPFWAEDACFEYEVINYWYNSKGGAKLDFETYVVNASVGFSCKTKAKYGDWEVALKANVYGETIDMGVAVLEDSMHAGNYRNNKQNIAYDETKMIMPELGNLEVDGTIYYADTTKSDFYTVDFNNLTCLSHKVGNKVRHWTYEFQGEVKLFHTVIFVVNGDFIYTTVEHGTAAVLPEGCDARSLSADISNVTETMLVIVK